MKRRKVRNYNTSALLFQLDNIASQGNTGHDDACTAFIFVVVSVGVPLVKTLDIDDGIAAYDASSTAGLKRKLPMPSTCGSPIYPRC